MPAGALYKHSGASPVSASDCEPNPAINSWKYERANVLCDPQQEPAGEGRWYFNATQCSCDHEGSLQSGSEPQKVFFSESPEWNYVSQNKVSENTYA